jgi:adenylate kinase
LWKIRKKLKNNILKMKNIIIFGAPGSGKGTYSDEIVAKYGMGHISTGDVLRGEIKNGTELGTIAKGYIDNGQLIPDELMIDILAKTYDSLEAGKGVIFDGFPRTIAQAEALKKMLAERNHDMGMMVELVVDEETLMARLLNRAIEQGRADDNEETIKKRFEVYHNQTAPLAEWFEKEGLRNTFTWKGSKEQMLSDIFEAIDAENK